MPGTALLPLLSSAERSARIHMGCFVHVHIGSIEVCKQEQETSEVKDCWCDS